MAFVVFVHKSNVASLTPNTCNFLSGARMIETVLHFVLYEVEYCKVTNDCSNHMVKWFTVLYLKSGISWLVRRSLELSMAYCLNKRVYWAGFFWGLSWEMCWSAFSLWSTWWKQKHSYYICGQCQNTRDSKNTEEFKITSSNWSHSPSQLQKPQGIRTFLNCPVRY